LYRRPSNRQKPNGSAERLLGEEEEAKETVGKKEGSSSFPGDAAASFSSAEQTLGTIQGRQHLPKVTEIMFSQRLRNFS